MDVVWMLYGCCMMLYVTNLNACNNAQRSPGRPQETLAARGGWPMVAWDLAFLAARGCLLHAMVAWDVAFLATRGGSFPAVVAWDLVFPAVQGHSPPAMVVWDLTSAGLGWVGPGWAGLPWPGLARVKGLTGTPLRAKM